MSAVSRVFGATGDRKTLVAAVADLSVVSFADWAVVDLLDTGAPRRVAVAHSDAELGAVARELRRCSGAPALQAGRTISLDAVQAGTLVGFCGPRTALKLRAHALLSVPLRNGARTLGALTFLRAGPTARFGSDDQLTAEELAAQVSLALENTRLREVARISADRNARLHRISAQLSGCLGEMDAVAVILDHALASLGARSGAVAVFSSGTEDELEVLGAAGERVDGVVPRQRLSVTGPAPLSQAVRYGRLVTSGEAVEPEETQRGPWAAVPLQAEGRVVGSLGLFLPNRRELDEGDRAFLLVLADQCGQALARARLYESERLARAAAEEAQRRLTFLLQAATELAGCLEIDETLSRVAHLAVPGLADLCTVTTPASRHEVQRVAVAANDPRVERLVQGMSIRYPLLTDGPLDEALRTGRPVLVPAVDDSVLRRMAVDEAHLDRLREVGARSLMIVPLASGELPPMGVVTFVACGDRSYEKDDLDLAWELCRRAGLSVAQSRLYEDARASVRAKDEFLSVASHELRTPLAALQLQVQGMLHALRRGSALTTERTLEQLEATERQVRRLGGAVASLLDVSTITAGRLVFHRERMDLAELTREVLERFAEDFQLARCPVSLEAPEAVVGEWDRDRLVMVLSSLFSNALKYGLGRPVELSIRAEDGEARLSVRDRGIGIPLEDQERIFGRFERAVPDRHYGGMGLGLWLARELVRGLGGDISVQSAPGEGAAFTVRLPGVLSRAAEAEREEDTRSSGSAA